MKIIKMGNIFTNRNTCPYCGCEYEYDESDTHIGYELTMQYAYVLCPCCAKINRLNQINWDKQYPPYPPLTPWSGTYVDISQHIPDLGETQEMIHQAWNPDIPDINTEEDEDE